MTAPRFKRIGGHPALDFVNTVHGRIAGRPRAGRDWADRIVGDRLRTERDLLDWAVEAELIGPKDRARLARSAAGGLARARRLRESLYRVFRAAIESWTPEPADAKRLNRELERARQSQCLVLGSGAAVWRWLGPADRHRIPGLVALAAAELLAGPDRTRIRQCEGERCRWLFLDRSKNGSRRWCDMADCGNRAKVRRFRRRKRSTGR